LSLFTFSPIVPAVPNESAFYNYYVIFYHTLIKKHAL